MLQELPQSVKACLWSYNIDKMDFDDSSNRKVLIKNVLDRGTKEAIDWLLVHFSKEEISESIKQSHASDWGKKSISLWSLVFNSYPIKVGRFE